MHVTTVLPLYSNGYNRLTIATFSMLQAPSRYTHAHAHMYADQPLRADASTHLHTDLVSLKVIPPHRT